jgi:hydrophobe/amphiphile efflux-1 (HAE1) family protein
MSISTPFIKRPIATSLLSAALLLGGGVAYRFLPVASLPQVEFPTISVSAGLPGASPETMASAVATPLERQFGKIAGVTEMSSSSQLGSTSITLQFDLSRNIDAAARDVQAAINAARGQLPSNLPSNPTYRKLNPADAPILILAAASSTLPVSNIYDVADSILAQKLSQVEGVGQVIVGGGAKPAVRVDVNPMALANYGIGLDDVRAALRAANANTPKGELAGANGRWTITATDQLLRAEQYRPLVIVYKQGAPVRLSDIAQVQDSLEDVHTFGVANGTPGVILIVFRQPGANIIGTVDRIRALFPELQASIPPAVKLLTIADRTGTIRASVHDVELTLVLTMGLVVMVIFLFLRNAWATVIPSVAMPLSLVGTFGGMYLLGYSIDNLSLMALTISTGFVVDDAIVVIENITRYLEAGETSMYAALHGAREVGFTVLSMSASLVAVFIPILLMGGIVGRLFREFAVTLTVAIGVSLVVSLSTTPMMCARFLRSEKGRRHGAFYRASERGFAWALDTYARGLRWVLRHQPLTLAIMLATVCLNVYLYIIVPKGFFPQQDTSRISGSIQAAQDISFDAMKEKLLQFNEIVMKDEDTDSLVAFTGGSGGATNAARMFGQLRPLGPRKVSVDQYIDRLRKKLSKVPGAVLYLQSVQDIRVGGRASSSLYQYTLQGENFQDLSEWAPKMMEALKRLPELRDVATDQQDRGLEASLVIDRDTAARLGLQPQQIDDALYDAFGQRQVSTIFTQLNQYHVVLEVEPRYQQNPDALKVIYARTPGGVEVPISAFTHFEPRTTALAVSHQGQFPAVTLSFNLALGAALGDAVKSVQAVERRIGLPASIHPSFQGTAQAFQSSLANEPWLILAALVTVYLVLGMLYESYIHPITILSTLPSAGVGAILALLLFHTDLSVIALIGILLLIGIVKKNAIMMIDFALDAERKEGKSAEDAIYQACLLRFRPIMMTTMAALFGALPLALGQGTGSELRRPLGISIMGGLLVSQVLTLYTTPVVYLYMDRLRLFFARGRQVHGPLQLAPGAGRTVPPATH